MEPWLLGAIAGGTVMLSALIVQRRTANRTTPEVLSILRERGPLTIPGIMSELGLEGISAQGRVVMALDTLIKRGIVHEQPVAADVPKLKRLEVRRYVATRS